MADNRINVESPFSEPKQNGEIHVFDIRKKRCGKTIQRDETVDLIKSRRLNCVDSEGRLVKREMWTETTDSVTAILLQSCATLTINP